MTQGGQQPGRVGDQPGGATPRGRLVEACGLLGADRPHGRPAPLHAVGGHGRNLPRAPRWITAVLQAGQCRPQYRPRRRVRTGRGGRSGRIRQPVRLDRTKGDELRNVVSQPTCVGADHEPRARAGRRRPPAGPRRDGLRDRGTGRMESLTCGAAGLRRLRQQRRAHGTQPVCESGEFPPRLLGPAAAATPGGGVAGHQLQRPFPNRRALVPERLRRARQQFRGRVGIAPRIRPEQDQSGPDRLPPGTAEHGSRHLREPGRRQITRSGEPRRSGAERAVHRFPGAPRVVGIGPGSPGSGSVRTGADRAARSSR